MTVMTFDRGKLRTLAEGAAQAGVSVTTFRNWVMSGRITKLRFGSAVLYRAEEIDAAAKARKTRGGVHHGAA